MEAVCLIQPGDKVYWWKRIRPQVDQPILAEMIAVGAKRVSLALDDPGTELRVLRHVEFDRVQPVEMYYCKSSPQPACTEGPRACWGRFTRYLEVGEDLWAVRQVDVFEHRVTLVYDRVHWVDEFGMLGDGRINRNRKKGAWGVSEEITPAEFDRIWDTALRASMHQRQIAVAKMSELGEHPTWLRAMPRNA